jgi:hypothetical protein
MNSLWTLWTLSIDAFELLHKIKNLVPKILVLVSKNIFAFYLLIAYFWCYY